ncbi:hypothetical protein GE061_012999 [Apolygus lucorum]|uniref:Uncharacterized protein n=1 Tax=Apolygus lucorum TaxID=248454 RepID=A0A8S9XWK9_APOLU|nr:hypothetical protein GE061_012999 [Apolygus lucorum]
MGLQSCPCLLPSTSPSSKNISLEASEAVVPPYSPSSPSHPPPSPSIDPSSPSSVESDRFSLSKVKSTCTPDPSTTERPQSDGSPHYSLDSLSSYSSSSFSSGLPSPSSGSPRYTPSPSENEGLLSRYLTPSPPSSPAVTLMSPRVSSSSSSSHSPPGLPDPPQSQGNVQIPVASLSMFSPSVSPLLPQFSPSSPSHQPPSPAYSPSSPSYSSGSCSPLESTSSGHFDNTFSSSPQSSHSSTSTENPTVVLKVFIPKSI